MTTVRHTTAPSVSDAVTTTNTAVVGASPAQAIGSLYLTIGNATAMSCANAVFAQQQTYVAYQSSTTVGLATLLGQNV